MPNNKRIPEGTAFHGFNNKKPQPATEDVDILHMAHGLFPLGLLTYVDVMKLATRLHSLMKDKTFTSQGKTYKVIKVFSAGNGCVKMRCEVLACSPSTPSETKAC